MLLIIARKYRMSASRLLRTSRTVGFGLSNSGSNASQTRTVRCPAMSKDDKDKKVYNHHHDVRPSMATAAARTLTVTQDSVSSTAKQLNWDLILSVLANVGHAALTISKIALEQSPWRTHIQMFTETGIVNCRFFTLLAIAGSLIGSVLCFIEGCFFVLQSYYQYLKAFSHRSDEGQVVRLLIEALDMFLMGTAIIIIGVGLYNMFVRSNSVKKEKSMSMLNGSKYFGISYLKAIPYWAELQSVFQANLNIGHALMLILQVGVLEKFKSVPLLSACDLACFAGAVLLSSASTFVLSKVSSTMPWANRIIDTKQTPCILV